MASDDDLGLPSRQSLFDHAGKHVRKRAEEKSRLRDVQKEALHSLEKWFTNPDTTDRTAVVVMPTGTGKTGVMCCLPYYLASTVLPIDGLNFSKPVLFIAPGLSISDQLTNELRVPSKGNTILPFLVKRGIIPNDTAKMKDFMPAVQKVEAADELCHYLGTKHDVVVTNAQKWHTGPTAVWPALKEDSFSLVIVDEAHHLPANQWKQIVEKFRGHAKVVFFTATPFRTDKKNICDDIMERGFAHELSRETAISMKIIREVVFTEFPVNPVLPEEDHYSILLHHAVECLKNKESHSPLPPPHKHVAMIIVRQVKNAKKMADIARLKYSDLHSVAMYHKAHEHDKAMEDIKSGKARIIIIVKMLLEGFDHPPVSIAAICTKIGSAVRFAQFIGRAQRVLPDEGDVKADVISLSVFEQKINYDNYLQEHLIPLTESDTEIDLEAEDENNIT